MISNFWLFVCDDCNNERVVSSSTKEDAFNEVRYQGWAIARDRNTCFCPSCSVFHRNVGCNGTGLIKTAKSKRKYDF